MIEIKDLLEKFGNTLLKEELKKETVRNAISETINIQIKSEDIKIKNNTVYLNIKPIYKNEIFLKKDFLLQKLQNSLGTKSPNSFK